MTKRTEVIGEFRFEMIGRADNERIKKNVAVKAWLPQASYRCGVFSDLQVRPEPTSSTYLLSTLVTEPGMLFKLPLLSLAMDDDRLLRPLPPKLSLRPVPREGLMYPPVGKT